MDDGQDSVQIGENKFEEGELIVEGLLNISWGLRRPIRLQMQDEKERIRPPPASTSWHSGCNLDAQRSPSDQRRIRRHRFSINGHYYNHKTAVFTPAYGTLTNVRINSCMSTPQVLRVLLSKIFLMEEDLGEEVTYDVAQYIKFEMPVLESFIVKLREEEDREVRKLRERYRTLRCVIERQLESLLERSTCV
ncbi:hypothetical protein JZ751_004626 [Albula glossodonta]|uniref:SARAH domain-containing protein n=1 Tax=Albula glossodonta TaxID=121402 RepID=A0A8T2N6C9_9TELE|nr:hypothetical protein JZ751_004626 [Albula glossodonta]